MTAAVTGCWLLVMGLFLQDVKAQLYSANKVVHPTCAGTELSMETTIINVVRGESGAPCTGYLNYDNGPGSRRMCGDANPQPLATKALAQRACYALGTNMYRPSGTFHANSNDQLMLFICDIYTEAGVAIPTNAGNVDVVTADVVIPSSKLCKNSPTSDDFCVETCYDYPGDLSDDTDDACEAVGTGPFWATTCMDVDECLYGVLAECTGPFPDSCTKRDPCAGNTVCENHAGATGGWTCECMDGYTSSDPYTDDCEDINECGDDDDDPTDEDLCGYHAQCINTPGSYICTCLRPELYDRDSRTCMKATCDTLPVLPYATPTTQPQQFPEFGDKVIYSCLPGYRVQEYALPETLLPYYGYITMTSFEMECTASGHWTPDPIPICYPIKCPDPGYVLNAQRSGSSWEFDDVVIFECQTGYQPDERTWGLTTFSRVCKADGTWTEGTTCEDVDECTDNPGICGAVAKYCINTIGSYMCSCVPWYQKNPTNNKCEGIEADGSLPSLKPCDLMDSLGLCVNGICYLDSEKAVCRCFDDYEGAACDRPKISPSLVIGIVALVLIVILVIVLLLYCCNSHCCCVKPHVQPAAVCHPAPPPPPPASRHKEPFMDPCYGGFMPRPRPPPRRWRGRPRGIFQ